MYSQHAEEGYILKFFEGKREGVFCDIGAYDGYLFSNTHQLALDGWRGVCIEPSKLVFPKLAKLYEDNDRVECINAAIGPKNGMIEFWDSAGAVATANEQHYDKWKDYQQDFVKTEVPSITFRKFYEQFPYKYDFINIDVEGLDFTVLKQIDLDVTGTSLVCIEYTYGEAAIMDYLESFGFKNVVHRNGENIIVGR